MDKISFENDNVYSQQFDTFKQSKLFKRLKEKFRVKPYHEENKTLRIVVLYSSYLFNIFSILTSFYYCYTLFNSFLGIVFGFIVSLSVLMIIEALKRLIVPRVFKNYLQFNSRSYLKLLVAVGLVSLSCFFSYHGGSIAVKEYSEVTPAPATDTAKVYFSMMIADRIQQQKQLSKVKYKGTTTRTAQKAINAIQAEINSLRSQETDYLKAKSTEEKQTATETQQKKYFNGLVFSLLAVIFDLSLIFCLWFLEYYDYRSYSEFATIDDSNTATVSNDNKPIGGGANEVNNKELTNDSKTIATTAQKNCLNCNAVFEVTNPKKKFCNTTCRVKHWEAKNKKTLTVPTA